MQRELVTIILAGGQGKRMHSDLPKVLHPLAGKPLVHHVIEIARRANSSRIILVISHEREMIRKATKEMNVEYAVQERPLGTGDAVKACKMLLHGFDGYVIILSGDVPLLKVETIERSKAAHRANNSAVTVFSFKPADPTGYGRIIRDENGNVTRIVEEKDASIEEKTVNEVNGGIYIFDSRQLYSALEEVNNDNASGEYYLTDTLEILRNRNLKLSAMIVDNEAELAGVNSQDQLVELEKELSQRDKL